MRLFYTEEDGSETFISEGFRDIPAAIGEIAKHQKQKFFYLVGGIELTNEREQTFLIVKKTGCKYRVEQ